MTDPFGALLPGPFEPVAGNARGPLAGVTFVAKDLFDVAGTVTGAGQPELARSRAPAETHAPAVRRLLDAGATLVGKAHTVELAFGLSGEGVRAGMPVNPAARRYDPGGSSSGSAAAVAGGLCDLGLGTDTLGSIRVPASYGGLWGWRPTHGLVPLDGVHPLAPSFDTVGLLARDPGLLATAAAALAAERLQLAPPRRVLLAADALGVVDDDVRAPVLGAAERLGVADSIDLAPPDHPLDELVLAFRDLQGPEFWAAHGAWVESAAPTFGPGVAQRVAYAASVTPEQRAAAAAIREVARAHLAAVLGPGDVVALPAAGVPPRSDAGPEERAEARRVAATLSVVGSLAGAPTVTRPAGRVGGAPVGLSLLALPGGDGGLLGLG